MKYFSVLFLDVYFFGLTSSFPFTAGFSKAHAREAPRGFEDGESEAPVEGDEWCVGQNLRCLVVLDWFLIGFQSGF